MFSFLALAEGGACDAAVTEGGIDWPPLLNFSSFGPDLIVGLLTGGLIAWAVFHAEKRRQKSAIDAEVRRHQQNVVAIARSTLRRSPRGRNGADDLHPDREATARLEAAVESSPVDNRGDVAVGYRLAVKTVEATIELDEAASELDAYLRDLRESRGSTVRWVVSATIHKLETSDVSMAGRWEWWDGTAPYADMASLVPDDLALRHRVADYVTWKRRARKYRLAFMAVEGEYRATVWGAMTARSKGAPHDRRTRRAREAAFNLAVQRAEQKALEATDHTIGTLDVS